jgi:hypothetical protein
VFRRKDAVSGENSYSMIKKEKVTFTVTEDYGTFGWSEEQEPQDSRLGFYKEAAPAIYIYVVLDHPQVHEGILATKKKPFKRGYFIDEFDCDGKDWYRLYELRNKQGMLPNLSVLAASSRLTRKNKAFLAEIVCK